MVKGFHGLNISGNGDAAKSLRHHNPLHDGLSFTGFFALRLGFDPFSGYLLEVRCFWISPIASARLVAS